MSGGDLSTGNRSAALIGLESTGQAQAGIGNHCDALFTRPRSNSTVPIAYFTDYRCVYCRQIGPMLERLGQNAQIAVTFHELPLLGPSSVQSARAALAARQQGAYDVFHKRLMGTPFLPNAAYLRQLAQDTGLDPDQLITDMDHPKIDRQLRQTAALAKLFGFYGTPALVVGRTAVLGNISQRKLKRLIAHEASEIDTLICR
ncbi:DsbA family protein [Roseovarius sp. EL26]|uniref:DsbA family protein n=1 Tax=Roseovarius sp. EL26 TaxID=2126672 RepID=UPI0013C41460|nr:DsbA family protein [Roseovarius sp. EL26]